jgi:hypothetical protein
MGSSEESDQPDDVWYYADASAQVGPLTLQELKSKLAAIPNSKRLFAWREGMSDWKNVSDIPELRARKVSPPPLPKKQRQPVNHAAGIKGLALFIAVIVVSAVLSAVFGPGPSFNTTISSPRAVALPTCRDDFKICKDNAEMINNYSKMLDATVRGKQELNKSVKFGEPEWSWVPFGSFYNGDSYIKTGVVKIVDNDVKIQNGFGAKVNSVVECWYDFNKKSATIIRASAR